MLYPIYQEFSETIKEGRSEFIYTIQTLLYQHFPTLFERLSFDNEKIFQEPLLFAWFNSSTKPMPMEQVLYGYMEDDKKPATIEVATNEQGIVYLPNLGYFETPRTNSRLTLHFSGGEYQLQAAQVRIPSSFQRLFVLPGTDIEIVRHNNPLLQELFKEADGQPRNIAVEDTLQKHHEHLLKAFALLQTHFPVFAEYMKLSVRKVMMYNDEKQRSFATLGAQGVGFLNVKDDFDEIAILEDITHQCGHVIFYPMSIDKQQFFNESIDTLLKKYTQNERDTRTILGAFYAMFPYSCSNQCSNNVYEASVFTEGKREHEFLGRFAFRMKKFKTDIANFDHPGIFTPIGQKMYEQFREIFYDIYEKRKHLLEQFDVSNQPYEFSYAEFLQLNPLHQLQS